MSDRKIIIISFLMAIILGLFTYLHGVRVEQREPREMAQTDLSDIYSLDFDDGNFDMHDIEGMKEIEEMFQLREDIDYEEFSEEGLSIEYPSHWQRIEEEEMKTEEEHKAETIFLSYYIYEINNTYHPTTLLIQEREYEGTKEEMIDEVTEDDSTEVIEKDDHYTIKKEGYLEEYGQNMIVKERVFSKNGKALFFSVFSTDVVWNEKEEELLYILNSIRIKE